MTSAAIDEATSNAAFRPNIQVTSTASQIRVNLADVCSSNLCQDGENAFINVTAVPGPGN